MLPAVIRFASRGDFLEPSLACNQPVVSLGGVTLQSMNERQRPCCDDRAHTSRLMQTKHRNIYAAYSEVRVGLCCWGALRGPFVSLLE